MDTIINEDTIKKLKDSGVFNQSDKIDINELSKKIPNFENLTPTDLMNIKKGEFPEDFPSDTQDIFKKIDSLGESDVVVNNLISKTRNKKISELGLNPSITDIRKKGKNIKDKISELNGEGFDILNNANELPMKFKNKNFADLDISELADLKSILKKSELPDIQNVSKKLNDIDDFLLTDVDIGGQNLKRHVQFQDNLAEINRFQKKTDVLNEVKKTRIKKITEYFSSFRKKKYSKYRDFIDNKKLKATDKIESKIFDQIKKNNIEIDGIENIKKKSFNNLSTDELAKFRNKINAEGEDKLVLEGLDDNLREIKDIQEVYELEKSFVRFRKNLQEIDSRKQNVKELNEGKNKNLSQLIDQLKKDKDFKDNDLINKSFDDLTTDEIEEIKDLIKDNKKYKKKLELDDDFNLEVKKMNDELNNYNNIIKKEKDLIELINSPDIDRKMLKIQPIDNDLKELSELITNLKKLDGLTNTKEMKKLIYSYKKTKIKTIDVRSVKDISLTANTKIEKFKAIFINKRKGEYLRKVSDAVINLSKKYPKLTKTLKGVTGTALVLGVVWLFFGRSITLGIEDLLGIESESEAEEVKEEEGESCDLILNPYDKDGGLYADCKEQYDKEKLCRSVINPYKEFDSTKFTISKSEINNKLSLKLEFDKNDLSIEDLENKLKELVEQLKNLTNEKGYEILKSLNKLPDDLNMKLFQNLNETEINKILNEKDNVILEKYFRILKETTEALPQKIRDKKLEDLNEGQKDIVLKIIEDFYQEEEIIITKKYLNKINEYLKNPDQINFDTNFPNDMDDELTNENLNNQIYKITSHINEFNLFINQLKNNYDSCKEKKEKEDKCMDEKHPNESRNYCPNCPDLYRTRNLIGKEDFVDNIAYFGGYQQCECTLKELKDKEIKYSSCQNKFNEIECMNTKNTTTDLNYLSCNHVKGNGYGIDARRNLNDPINPDGEKNSESEDFLDSHYMISIWGMTEDELYEEVDRIIAEENNYDLANAIIVCWEDYQYLNVEEKQEFLSLNDEEKAAAIIAGNNLKIDENDKLVYEFDDFIKEDEIEEKDDDEIEIKKDNRSELAKFLETKTFIYIAIGIAIFFFLLIIILILKKK